MHSKMTFIGIGSPLGLETWQSFSSWNAPATSAVEMDGAAYVWRGVTFIWRGAKMLFVANAPALRALLRSFDEERGVGADVSKSHVRPGCGAKDNGALLKLSNHEHHVRFCI